MKKRDCWNSLHENTKLRLQTRKVLENQSNIDWSRKNLVFVFWNRFLIRTYFPAIDQNWLCNLKNRHLLIVDPSVSQTLDIWIKMVYKQQSSNLIFCETFLRPKMVNTTNFEFGLALCVQIQVTLANFSSFFPAHFHHREPCGSNSSHLVLFISINFL